MRDLAGPEGRVLRRGVVERRRVLRPPAARRRGGDQPVQLPGNGAVLVLPGGDRHREHGDPQAEREGSVRRQLARVALVGSGAARRRVQRRPRRQGRGRPTARAPRREGGVLRRIHADRPVRLRDRHRQRQAGAGARWRQEPHGGAPRRRPRPGGRRGGERRVRLGRRALHGDLSGRRGRRRRR